MRYTFISDDYAAVKNDVCYEDQNEDYCGDAIDKLAAYEDAEEQGRLVILPCKIGDTVYCCYQFDEIENGKITMIQQKADGTWKFRVTTDYSRDVTMDAIGKTVFLTREEAETAIKEKKENVG